MPKYTDAKGVTRTYPGAPFLRDEESKPTYPIVYTFESDELDEESFELSRRLVEALKDYSESK